MLDRHRIFAHRGVWGNGVEGNSPEALAAAFDFGFSLETDVRDHEGRIVVAHDPVRQGQSPMSLDDLLAKREGHFGLMALNVKSDGLIGISSQVYEQVFFFDMSSPEALRYAASGLEYALRLSDREPFLIPEGLSPQWLWVDCFDSDWYVTYDFSTFQDLKGVILVSPELHGRNKSHAWKFFEERWKEIPNLCVCTDFPIELLEAVE